MQKSLFPELDASRELPCMNQLVERVLTWAANRDLLDSALLKEQSLKLVEEVGETVAAILRLNKAGQRDKVLDGIGDCLVVLIILAGQIGSDASVCLHTVVETIEKRTGKTVGGVFQKDGES